MRKKETNDGLTVKAIAGNHVVMLGMDLAENYCDGLMGFAIHRTDHTEQEAYWMEGMNIFKSCPPKDLPLGERVITRRYPLQGFTWSDFSAKPDHDYTYRVLALYAPACNLQEKAVTEVSLRTESEIGNTHNVFFNRGAAGCQQYARRFHHQSPQEVGEPAFRWLSRGLHEGILNLIAQAKGSGWGLLVAAYEFTEESVLQALRDAEKRGVDLKIIYHARERVSSKTSPKTGKVTMTQTGLNRQAVAAMKFATPCIERLAKPEDISHNKFIVLLKANQPVAVLTGSTNFSTGGIFGHSNVVHVVKDEKVAAAFRDYWQRLSTDPDKYTLGPALTQEYPLPADSPPVGTITIFSPRQQTDALDFYARLASGARNALFMSFAFGMHTKFQEVYRTGTAPLRYALMEKMVVARRDKAKEKAEEQKIITLRKMPENLFAIGGYLGKDSFDRWLAETLSGLNAHVRYVHTKYMLVDPLSDDPLVVSGSANFSDPSCNENDENMLVIRGNQRVADIYLGEFMRLYHHYAFREWASIARQQKKEPEVRYLDEKNMWWRPYFGNTVKSRQRDYFSK
jgi:phosphatidylserine/phosphatidylglycerophosphate/cardiolipin synthase-like enzyme